jgi:hypothetical protein
LFQFQCHHLRSTNTHRSIPIKTGIWTILLFIVLYTAQVLNCNTIVVDQCSHIVLSLSSQYLIPTELLYLEYWMLMRKDGRWFTDRNISWDWVIFRSNQYYFDIYNKYPFFRQKKKNKKAEGFYFIRYRRMMQTCSLRIGSNVRLLWTHPLMGNTYKCGIVQATTSSFVYN